MNIKKIVAPTMPEAMRRVKSELGEDAVILNSKVAYTGGFLGLFKRKSFEVVAAVDESHLRNTPRVKEKNRKSPKSIQPEEEGIRKISAAQSLDGRILAELADLKKSLPDRIHQYSHLPEPIQTAIAKLQKQDVHERHVAELGEKLLIKWRQSRDPLGEDDISRLTHTELVHTLGNLDFSGLDYQKKFVALAGPTGVGKTTTLAKLAAHAVIKDKKKIGFITLDTYRIGAIEQLKTYAQLLNVPVEVVYKQEDFLDAAQRLSACDMIFVDTAGRNYRQMEFIQDLKKILDTEDDLSVYLVLSLSMKERDMKEITDNFKAMDISQFIFTKIDETATYGAMFNLMLDYNIGTAFLTTGQDVPEDIIPCEPDIISRYLLGAEPQ